MGKAGKYLKGTTLLHLREAVPRDCRTRRAFTLVEVLVVMAILGVLVTLLLPAVRGSVLHCHDGRAGVSLPARDHLDSPSRFVDTAPDENVHVALCCAAQDFTACIGDVG
jgi:prepilin-type N-terminal cleavage/methylation domain-containing protein